MARVWWSVMAAVLVAATLAVDVLSAADDVEDARRTTQETGCRAGRVCCQGKNNTCRVDGPRVSNSDSFTCFCDSACSELGDCCVDYQTTCQRTYSLHVVCRPPLMQKRSLYSRPHRSTTYVDAAYCGRWSSVVCGSQCLSRS